MADDVMEKIVSLAKRRGFIYPGSEIYGGLAGTWDYGPLGVELKNNIKALWWRMFVQNRDDMYGMDAAIIMNPKAWEASGHVSGFSDPLSECKICKHRFRTDQIADPKVCPDCGGKLSSPRQFNMMFKTSVGAAEDESSVVYLRPETAGGMFVNFKNVLDSLHPSLPFGLGQIGKAFRNEIAPRDFIFRSREFEQMEVEYFVRPDTWAEHFEAWRKAMWDFIVAIGITKEKVSELEVEDGDRAHYSKRTIDFEFEYPFGKKELYGLAYRTDFDLKAHSDTSTKPLTYAEESEEPFHPHVIEPSFGVDRTVLAVLTSAYAEEGEGDEKRVYLKLAPMVAPIKAAVSPLLKNKPELVTKAREVYLALKKEVPQIMWDDNGNIGKRYRRQDEIGTPFCIVIDFDTLGEKPELTDTVTLRHRDTGEQERLSISDAIARVKDATVLR
ncbi:MAG: glycine--tRNA ligase [Candidatus Pacebacteria bacterium]|nr:glycine--tRNA ligase [Candidatus Paceibacterota bacterium]